MYCGQCGSYVRDGAQFCPCCGAIMEESTELDEEGVYTGRTVPPASAKKHRKWPWILAIILVLIAAAFVAIFFWMRSRNTETEDVFVTGQDSYTALITSYLEEASANDTSAVLDLFFPNSEAYYQNADNSLTTLNILQQEDNWTGRYGSQVTGAELGDATFADLSGEQASNVANIIAGYAGLEDVSELYTVDATITYRDGSSVEMIFEIVQCEYGCYLVAVQ